MHGPRAWRPGGDRVPRDEGRAASRARPIELDDPPRHREAHSSDRPSGRQVGKSLLVRLAPTPTIVGNRHECLHGASATGGHEAMSFRMRRGRASFSVGPRGPRASHRLGCLVPGVLAAVAIVVAACGGTLPPNGLGRSWVRDRPFNLSSIHPRPTASMQLTRTRRTNPSPPGSRSRK